MFGEVPLDAQVEYCRIAEFYNTKVKIQFIATIHLCHQSSMAPTMHPFVPY